ncbi:hypothetical protein D9615_004121 [Tricholomella constricta]|uniref:LigT-like protein n=1 Tax=Tricholomella constricta TaxID=117010 RepID=A0A8H5HD97_9AGAR|nr:hypothetical protein D9615_004121 [Tricholomella constricta]
MKCKPNHKPFNMGISLWLVPSAKDARRLSTIMRARQDEYPNFPFSYPTFDPHITLASCPSSSAPSLSMIRAAIPKFEHGLFVKFKSVEIGTHFFRSVYTTIAPLPALSALHEEVHAKLGIEARTPLFPHMSLCYIDDRDALLGERDKFLQELKDGGKIKEADDGSGVSLNCGDLAGDWMDGFQATEIWVANCDGPVEGWKIVDKVPLI